MNITKEYLYTIAKQQADELQKTYKTNGTISWTTFESDQNAHKEKVVRLTNNDFKYGTLRIREPCLLILDENISFNPNRPTSWLDINDQETSDFTQAVKINPSRTLDWFPNPSQPNNAQYFEPEIHMAYTLGFFAAIAVESDYVLINLNGYTLEQHPEHALQQRFFANIELADQPFIMKQGPHNFGNVLRSARNLWIYNGKIGRSSHHGIHGNGANNIYIENVNFIDFEVGAISLNASKNVFLKGVTLERNRRDVPVLGTYSAGRFIKSFVSYLQSNNLSTVGLNNAFNILKVDLDKAFDKIIFNSGSVPGYFENTAGLTDGNSYGIVVNPKGVAVLNLAENRASNRANETSNIVLDHCSVNGIHCNIREIVALSVDNGSHAPQVDTAGSVLQIFNDVANKIGDKYYYQGTSLSDVKIELAKIRTSRIDANLPVTMFGTLNIPKGTQVWKDDSDTYFERTNNTMKLMKTNVPHLVDGQEVIYEILCNGDTMFHVNKGAMGVRIDGGNTICIDNCVVSDILNKGIHGSELCGNYIGSHPDQGSAIGYGGTPSYGVVMSAVNDVKCNNLGIQSVESEHGSASGFIIQNDSYNLGITNTKIKDIKASINDTFNPNNSILPNQLPISTGLTIGCEIFNVNIKNVHVSNIETNVDNPFERDYDIRCNINID